MGGKQVSIPLVINGGPINDLNAEGVNMRETYRVDVVRGARRGGTQTALTNAEAGTASGAVNLGETSDLLNIKAPAVDFDPFDVPLASGIVDFFAAAIQQTDFRSTLLASNYIH